MTRAAAGSSRGHRRAALLLAVVLAGAGASVPAPATATAYRYWTYWTAPPAGSAWTFSQVGPASTVPRHGAVEGWRFSVSTGARGQGSQPRIAPTRAFQQFCGADAPATGKKRVVVVFDFGDSSDAPDGQPPPQARGTCVEIERSATGGEILSRAADVRVEAGLVCAIGGYPRGECAPAVPTPRPSPDPTAKKNPAPKRSAPAEGGKDDGGTDNGGTDNGGTDNGRPRDVTPDEPGQTDPGNGAPGATDDRGGGNGTDNDTKRGDGPAATEPPSAGPSPSATGSPTRPAGVTPSPSPVFVSADARTDDEAGPRWGLAAAILSLGAVGAYLLLRRRPRS